MIKVGRSPAIDRANPNVLTMSSPKSVERFDLCIYHALAC